MKDDMPKTDPEHPGRPLKRKTLMGCLLAAIVCFLGVSIYLLMVMYWAFDKQPLPMVARTPDPLQLEALMNKLYQTSDQNADITAQLMGLMTQQERTINLSKDEVNAMIDYSAIAGRLYLSQKYPALTISDARFLDGTLQAEASLDTGIPTPFGKYLNIKIRLIPHIQDKKMSAKVKYLSVGKNIVSGRLLQGHIDNQTRVFNRSKTGVELLEVVTLLDVKPEDITITVNTQKMTMFLASRLGYATDISIED